MLKIIVAATLASVAWSGTAAAQDALPVFKSSVDVVPISASVRDGHGRAVTTLRAADFEVLDNGVRRPILGFDVDDRTPITIAILVDTSASRALDLAADARRVAGIVDELRKQPGGGSVPLLGGCRSSRAALLTSTVIGPHSVSMPESVARSAAISRTSQWP